MQPTAQAVGKSSHIGVRAPKGRKKTVRDAYAPNNNSPSLTTCNSIHPSSGKESTGNRFCHKLNRNRILLVGVLDAVPAFFSELPSEPEVGTANNHVSGTLNSKFRSSAIAACSSL